MPAFYAIAVRAGHILLTSTTCTLSRFFSESVSCRTLAKDLREHSEIELNRGKTRIWKATGDEPAKISNLHSQNDEPIWTGDWVAPRHRQGPAEGCGSQQPLPEPQEVRAATLPHLTQHRRTPLTIEQHARYLGVTLSSDGSSHRDVRTQKPASTSTRCTSSGATPASR